MTVAALFQSTPPVKAATAPELSRPRRRKISIHAAREGGDGRPSMVIYDLVISIHAAREGGDLQKGKKVAVIGISIHAAREGGDYTRCWVDADSGHFNPRRP